MKAKKEFKRKVVLSIVFLVALMGIFSFIGTDNLYADETQEVVETGSANLKWGLIAASIAFGFGALGAGIAIANVGSAAMGAIGEKPEIASQALIFVALAEGVVVFGFITALMILGKV
ncbi:MAG: ATP synthase subunit C [Spirochaetales bacterium]|uniref:ATP synthase subunit C n=1 Tax=Candidatus Thalassospirochaeta sargassi TaxID=3119039 RepID=A0AAJ1IIH0_9SPIO|nr:ATP synthase subunit C [Spirochaetales bacterium]